MTDCGRRAKKTNSEQAHLRSVEGLSVGEGEAAAACSPEAAEVSFSHGDNSLRFGL